MAQLGVVLVFGALFLGDQYSAADLLVRRLGYAVAAGGAITGAVQTSPVQARRHDNLNARPWGRPYGDRLPFGSAVQPRTWPPNDNRSRKVVPEQGVQVVTAGEVWRSAPPNRWELSAV